MSTAGKAGGLRRRSASTGGSWESYVLWLEASDGLQDEVFLSETTWL